MVSVTQRITQYNKEVGQPHGGLVKPSLFVSTAIPDGRGSIDAQAENIHAGTVGTAVDYLARLARVLVAPDELSAKLRSVFSISLRGAERIDNAFGQIGVTHAAEAALATFRTAPASEDMVTIVMNEVTVAPACQLASYDVGLRADPGMWNPENGLTGRAPDTATASNVLAMVDRTRWFAETFGPIMADGFVFVDMLAHLRGERGGYTDLVDSGDGDFLTEDTLWDFKVSVAKPSKDHTLQVLMYYLMGKESGLAQFDGLTHVGIFNPRLGIAYRLGVDDISADIIETARRDVIGYES